MALKLFVGGLSWDTTDSNLANFFAQAGKVTSATVIVDKMSGKSKGFGFVEMSSEEEAKTAIAKLNGQSLDGRTVAVSEARPQAPRGDFNRDRNQQGNFRRPRY
jgi:RNA recognition motif-containing protein